VEVELRTMNPTVELVLKHKKANMRKAEFLMLEALKSVPHLNDTSLKWVLERGFIYIFRFRFLSIDH
jgi:hypothetical protein